MEGKSKKIRLPDNKLNAGELALGLSVLAREYQTSLPALLRKLDRVSGNLEHLQAMMEGDNRFEWTEEEDDLLSGNEGLLVRWKGKEAVELRKKYLNWKA